MHAVLEPRASIVFMNAVENLCDRHNVPDLKYKYVVRMRDPFKDVSSTMQLGHIVAPFHVRGITERLRRAASRAAAEKIAHSVICPRLRSWPRGYRDHGYEP